MIALLARTLRLLIQVSASCLACLRALTSKSSSGALFTSCADALLRSTSARAQTTPLNPVVNSFTPSQAMVDPHEFIPSTNDHLAAQQAMVNPYESAVHANSYLAVQQNMMNPYALTLPSNNYPAVQQPLDYQYQQQVYNSAGQIVMPPFYGPAGPMDFAGSIPTAGPTNQLAAGPLHHASVNSKNSTKVAGKSPLHKPGKECPEGNANCHSHYTGSCHENPATCTLARKFLQPLVYLILAY